MALELDGKPFRLSKEDLVKYSKKFIFRVGVQHIKVNHNPELPRVEVSPVHINTEYRHYRMDGSVREPMGKLVYFESKNYNADAKRDEYTPARIALTYKGYITVMDPELNYFLDNHPHNESVKSNPEHPNFQPNVETYFATYVRERKRATMVENIRLASELSLLILDPQEYGYSQLKALATLVQRSAKDYRIAHMLHSVDDKDEADIRSELARLCSQYPQAMRDLMDSKNVNYLEWVKKFAEVKLVQVVNNEWFIADKSGKGTPLMKVLDGHDAIHSLSDWFQNFDVRQAKFKLLKERYAELEARRKAKNQAV